MNFTRDQLDAIDIGKRNLDNLRGGGARVGENHGAGGVFQAAGGGGGGPAADTGITFTEKPRATCGRSWRWSFGTPGSRRCTVSARAVAENAVFAGVDPEFRIVEGNEAWRMQQNPSRGHRCAVSRARSPAAGADPGLASFEFEERFSRLTTPCAERACGWESGRLSGSAKASPPARSPP